MFRLPTLLLNLRLHDRTAGVSSWWRVWSAPTLVPALRPCSRGLLLPLAQPGRRLRMRLPAAPMLASPPGRLCCRCAAWSGSQSSLLKARVCTKLPCCAAAALHQMHQMPHAEGPSAA